MTRAGKHDRREEERDGESREKSERRWNRSKECGSDAWVGRDKKKEKHRNNVDKNITDRKQRGRGEQWTGQQTEKNEEELHIYTTKAENVQTE